MYLYLFRRNSASPPIINNTPVEGLGIEVKRAGDQHRYRHTIGKPKSTRTDDQMRDGSPVRVAEDRDSFESNLHQAASSPTQQHESSRRHEADHGRWFRASLGRQT